MPPLVKRLAGASCDCGLPRVGFWHFCDLTPMSVIPLLMKHKRTSHRHRETDVIEQNTTRSAGARADFHLAEIYAKGG